ncbi:S8 family peptidase [Actinoplanes sp. NPDC051494]|uniref:S8 family peptidase n=1 Tax=Actinoplanes sp. NPDC051494 TaxID=3363907 RepID=UPI003794B1D3
MSLVRKACGVTAFVALLAVTLPAAPARADSVREAQWFWNSLKVSQAQQLSRGDGVVVAMLDTGVDRRHPDLDGAVLPGRQIVQDAPVGDNDPEGHGTALAGIIAARGHGAGEGVLGIAPEAEIMPILPINDPYVVAQGITYAVEHGAKIVNMSFEVAPSQSLQEAVHDARDAGVLLVGAAGNQAEEGNAREYPGAYPEVLTVGALDRDNKIADFSNHGDHVDLAAPGVDIPGPAPDDGYATQTGSSASAAIVSGAAALIWSRYPDLTVDEVEARLTGTAIDAGKDGRDDYYGAGRLNLMAALTAPQPDPSEAPPAEVAAPVTPIAAPALQPPGQAPSWLFPLAVGAGVLLLLILLVLAVRFIRRRPI